MIIVVRDLYDPLAAAICASFQKLDAVTDIAVTDDTCESVRLPAGGVNCVWVVADAHAPVMARVMRRTGRKIALVRQAKPFLTDLSGIELLVVFSRYLLQTLTRFHPELQSRIKLCRMPLIPESGHSLCRPTSACNQIILLQPFTAEALNVLAVHFGTILVAQGYRIQFLLSGTQQHQHLAEADLCLLREGLKRGIDFVFCSTREMYYSRICRGHTAMSLEWVQCPSVLLAAAGLGLSVVAPAYGAYPEFFTRNCLYEPMHLDQAQQRLANPSQATPAWNRYRPELFASDFSEAAGL